MILHTAAIQHSLDHVRGAFDALQDGAWDAADMLVGAGARPGSTAAAGRVNASFVQTSAVAGHVLQAGDDVGALFWVLLGTMFFIVPCLVFLLFGVFRYFDLAASSASPPKRHGPRASISGAATKVQSDSSSSTWSAASGLCTAYVPAPGNTQPLRVLAGKTSTGFPAGVETRHSLTGSPSRGAPTAPDCQPSARFVVPAGSVTSVGDAGRVDLVDAVGGLGLTVVVSQNDQGLRKLELLTQALAPCASAEPAEGAQGGVPRLELRGPSGVPLGSLAPRADGAVAVHRHGQPQLIICGNEVCTEDGQLAATVLRSPQDGPSGAEHVELNIFDSANVHLVVCCVFAVLLLCRKGPCRLGFTTDALAP